MKIFTLLFLLFSVAGCSSIQERTTLSTITANPLKSWDDVRIESLLIGGEWLYQQQTDDCKDTQWAQQFYKSKYYRSDGSACSVADTFAIDAENWHVKSRVLYIINLSPVNGEDIILKYGVSSIKDNKMVLRSGKYTYTFIRS